jgi:hypothetical protein
MLRLAPKAALTLMVCNLLVVVTYVYCLYWKEDGDGENTEKPHTDEKQNEDHMDLGTAPRTEITFTEISQGTSSNWRSEFKQTTRTCEIGSGDNTSRIGN